MAVPSPPTNQTPADRATGVDANAPTLTWNAAGATSCRVYLVAIDGPALQGPVSTPSRLAFPNIARTGIGVVDGGGTWSYVANTGDPEPQGLATLGYPIVFAWQVIAVNADGETPGPVWTFTSTTRTPASGGVVPLLPTLTWVADFDSTYDIYFGTSNPPPLVSFAGLSVRGDAGVTVASYAPAGPLINGTTYYWKIVATNIFGATTWPTWSFVASEDSVTVLTSTSTGTLSNFNAGALGNLNVLRMNNATLATILGLTNSGGAPSDGTMVWIESVGAGQVDIANQDAGATAAYRVINGVTGKISLVAGVGRALLCYDATTQRWRVLEHEQGAAITPASPQTFFSGSSSMTWTVDVADVTSFNYYVRGRKLAIAFDVLSTTVGGTLNGVLIIQVPGGFTSATTLTLPFQYVDNGGAQAVGWIEADAGSPFLSLRKFGAGNWTASTNNTQAYGSIEIDVQ